MKKDPLIYIVILNWNGLKDTIECVNSILQIEYNNYIIVLVDNGSAKNEANALQKLYGKNKKILIIKNSKNLGFSGGVNVGIKESLRNHASYTLLLNNDTIVDKLFLKELIDSSEKNINAGIVSPHIFYYDKPTKTWENGTYINYWFPPISHRNESAPELPINMVVGCSMLIKNSVFKSIGLFKEEYFAYSEDEDFSYRALHKGYQIYSSPYSKVWHKVSKSSGGGFNKIVAYYKVRNKILFAKANLPIYYLPTYMLYVFIFFMYHQIRSFLSRKFSVNSALFKGFIDGIMGVKYEKSL